MRRSESTFRWRAGRRVGRGMSLLEVILAVVLLGMVAVMAASVTTYIHRQEIRRQMKTGATELCNRVLLQYMDDPDALKTSQYQAFRDGSFLYRWEINERPLTVTTSDDAIMQPNYNYAPSMAMLAATRVLEVKVFRAVEDGVGGSREMEELASLTRIHNQYVLSGKRNPDTLGRLPNNAGFSAGINALMMGSTGGGAKPAAPSDKK